MKKLLSIILCLIMCTVVMCSCVNSNGTSHEGLKIVCTAFPQYDYVKNILGSEEGLSLLLDDGADLHSYEPTATDIIEIASADLFIYIGGISDSWVEGTLKSANSESLKPVALMDMVETYEVDYVAGMEKEHNHIHESEHEKDEHIWLSLRNSAEITKNLCEIICEIDSANSEKYKTNAENYINSLNALDGEYKSVIESANRNTLLFADRFPFRYLVEDYGLDYHAAFSGCSSESEASFQTMAFLIDKTKELKLPAVIITEGSDGSIAEMICSETGAKILTLDSCQSVSSADIARGTNYLDIMRNNLEILREALN
ncbi:MAG: zinc ABC transporter substrate-binding protein [Clostridia bacterium]|nr:zinc ABC transporter substrate-binding protein [Clostridia bacterium]MBR3818354.1 zinc ABC transporter substrate-binding protein [Clostridia bacterium]